MGIVRFALRFPHTFYVMAALIPVLGVSAVAAAPKDIFPNINIPVVTVIWQYTGLTPQEMEQRITTYSEYSISSTVNDIRNIESQTLSGVAVEKIYFQPKVNIDLAVSQIVSASNSIRALMPPGVQPPVVVQYNASSVPVLQLSLSSDRLNEQQLFMTTASIRFGRRSPRYRGSRCQRPMVVNTGRSWSISIRTRCGGRASPPTTW
jgi:multidrug efflux pump subunit AcrB